jgi:Ca2+/H+ antiporter, TMEM165/GDT1 family
VSALLAAFDIVFVAELGDKSMLLVMALATRYRWWSVLLGATLAAAVMMGVAVLFGEAASLLFPDWVIGFAAAGIFFAFGTWAIMRGGLEDDDEVQTRVRVADGSSLRAITTTFGLLAMAEFGDKTQLAVVSLTALNPGERLWIWVGATAAMIVILAAAIAVGSRLANLLSARRVAQLAGLTFLVFGVIAVVATLGDLW